MNELSAIKKIQNIIAKLPTSSARHRVVGYVSSEFRETEQERSFAELKAKIATEESQLANKPAL